MKNFSTIAESFVMHSDVRQVCLEILADSVSTAHKYMRWCWHVEWKDYGINFSVEKTQTYGLGYKELLLKLNIQSLSPEIIEKLKPFVPEVAREATQGVLPIRLPHDVYWKQAGSEYWAEQGMSLSAIKKILSILPRHQQSQTWPLGVEVKVNVQSLSPEIIEKLKPIVPEVAHQVTQGILPILLPYLAIQETWPLIKYAYLSFPEIAETTLKHVYIRSAPFEEVVQYLRFFLNRPLIEEAGFIPPFKRTVSPNESDGAIQRADVIKLPWKILPPGEHPFSEILKHYEELQKSNPHVRYDLNRLNRICELTPTATYVGVDEFRGYTVFYFQKYLAAVLDCPVWGNAIYMIKGDWKTLSRLTKAELIAERTGNVTRIVHSGDWFQRLKNCLRTSEST